MRLLLHEFYAILDVLVAHVTEEAAHNPGHHVVEVYEGDERQPEPDKHEHLLVEEVYGQHALHRVGMHLSHVSHLEVAHGHAWEVDRVGGVPALHDVLYDLDAVQVKVLVAEEHVEQEELPERVGQVADLDEEVEHDEVGAADGSLVAAAAADHVGRV